MSASPIFGDGRSNRARSMKAFNWPPSGTAVVYVIEKQPVGHGTKGAARASPKSELLQARNISRSRPKPLTAQWNVVAVKEAGEKAVQNMPLRKGPLHSRNEDTYALSRHFNVRGPSTASVKR